MLLAELETLIDKWFHAVLGPPWAYFELPRPDGYAINRYVYQTLGYQVNTKGMTTDQLQTASEQLVRLMTTDFQRAREHFGPLPDPERDTNIILPPMLFWRRKLAFEAQQGFARLTCRVVIPGYSFSKPAAKAEGELWENVEFKPEKQHVR